MLALIYAFVIERLRERSTWAGLIGTLAVKGGLHFSGDQTSDLVNVGLAAIAALVAFVPEKPADTSHPPFV